MADISKVGISSDALSSGAWVHIIEDIRIRCRAANSPEYRAAVLAECSPDGEITEEGKRRAAARGLPSDVEGLTEDGEPVTLERLSELLLQDDWSWVLDICMRSSLNLEAIRDAHVEAAKGN